MSAPVVNRACVHDCVIRLGDMRAHASGWPTYGTVPYRPSEVGSIYFGVFSRANVILRALGKIDYRYVVRRILRTVQYPLAMCSHAATTLTWAEWALVRMKIAPLFSRGLSEY